MGLFRKADRDGKLYGPWWYDFQFEGIRYRESTKSPDRRTAERIERERRRNLELRRGGIKEAAKPRTFAVASKDWLTLHPKWSDNQRRIEGYNLRHLTPYFGKLLITDITGDDVARYQVKRKDVEQASPKTINLEVGTLRAIMRKHRQWERIRDDVDTLKPGPEVGRALSDDEQHRLLVACKASRSRGLYPAFLLALRTGLRIVELRHLQWRNIDIMGGLLTVSVSKTDAGEGRRVPISPDALDCLKKWRSQFPKAKPEHYVFPSERYGLDGERGYQQGKVIPYLTDPTKPISSFKVAWTAARKKAGVKCRWHDARHTAVSAWGRTKANDRTIMEATGHMSKEMMKRYLHNGDEDKRQMVAEAHYLAVAAKPVKRPAKASTVKQLPQFSHLQGTSVKQPIM